MKDFFRKWLGLYKANDLQEFTALRTFYTIAGIAVFALTSLLILRLITQDYDEAIFFLAGLVVIFFLVLLARRGLYQWSSWLFSLFIFAIITLRALDLQIFDNAFFAYPALIALAGLLNRRAGVIVFTLLSIASAAVMGVNQISGQGEQEIIYSASADGPEYLFILILFLAVSGSALLTMINNLIGSAAVLHQTNQELAQASQFLEERVSERTAQLDRKSSQLEAASLVARSAAETTNIKILLDNVVEQISSRFGFYHTGIFLSDSARQKVYLAAASSEGGKQMLERGHSLDIGRQGVVGYAAYEKRPRVAQDIERENVYFRNPELPDTRSEAALPLLIKNQVIGVLDIQSTEENPFGTEDLFILQTMADQIALAIQNARLLEESQLALEQLQAITTKSVQNAWQGYLGRQAKGYIYSAGNVTPINEAKPNIAESKHRNLQISISLRGQNIGKISLARNASEADWTEKEQEFTEKIAAQIALAVENARLLEDSQHRAAREQTLNELTTRLSRSLDLENLLQNAVLELHKIPQVIDASVVIAPQETGKQG